MAIKGSEFDDKLNDMVNGLLKAESGLLLLTGKRLEGLMKSRIFQDGKATNNAKIGKYKTTSWVKFRRLNNLQTDYVDLSVTQKLERAIQPVEDGDDVVIAITNEKSSLIAKGQEEKNYKKKIFPPTTKEIDQIAEYYVDIFNDRVDKIVASL